MRILALVCLAAAFVLNGGCGTSDEDEIRAAVRDFMFGIVEGDWERACDVMTEDAQASLRTADMPEAGCEQSLATAFQLRDSDRQRLKQAFEFAITKIDIKGERATVHLKETFVPDARPVANLRREDGWRIHGP